MLGHTFAQLALFYLEFCFQHVESQPVGPVTWPLPVTRHTGKNMVAMVFVS